MTKNDPAPSPTRTSDQQHLATPQIVALYQRGDYAALAEHASQFLWDGRLNGDPQAAMLVAIACAAIGEEAGATQLFEALIQAEPLNTAYRMNLAVFHLQGGRAHEARALLERCVQEQAGDPAILFNLGLACFAQGDFLAAKAALAPVFRMDPRHEVCRLYLARSLGETGDFQGAQALAERQAFARVDGVHERFELATLYSMIDQPEQAERVLRDLVERYPAEPNARLNLAGILERANRLDEAQALLDALPAPAAGQCSSGLLLTRAKLIAGQKDWPRALEAFDRAFEAAGIEFCAPALLKVRGDIEFGRGQALDKLKRYDDAHSTLVRANALIRDHFRYYNPARKHEEGRRIESLFDTPELDDAVRQAAGEVPLAEIDTPIFLVGFPRSGTTLLDQILDAHPRLQVLEEKPAIDTVAAAVGKLTGGYPQALARLSLADAARLRSLYWQTVSKHLARRPGTRLVDKYPLNLARIHLIMRLFPSAKWIFAIRHPCDVVLSCFMQNFRFTESTHGFWSIDQTASIYEQIMALWLCQRERLRPDCLDLRYEDLIEDFQPNARRLTDFLGLPWEPAVLQYNEHAKTRRISTPSYNQVVEPIYKTAAGRWKHYERYFESALPMLRPFIEQLGYTE